MSLQKQLGSKGELRKAIKEIQGLKQIIVTGADVATNIPIHDIKEDDAIAGVVNLTDLTNLDIAGVKASNDTWTGDFDTVIEATSAGVAGNDITVSLAGDALASTTVVVTVDPHAKTVAIRYKTAVTTIADVEAAIDALTGDYAIIAVKTAGTGATVLTASGDNVEATNLTGGVDEVINEIPVITSRGNIQFTSVDTTDKKLLVTYYVTSETD